MAWLAGLKIKKNLLLEQPPLVGDDAELAAMRRMVMADAMKRQSMAQRVGVTAYIKNRPQADATFVKNVVSNVSSFNRYRSEKDYEEWVIKERERAARLRASRSERISERSDVRLPDSDGESTGRLGSKHCRDVEGGGGRIAQNEEGALKRQVIERLRRARAGDGESGSDAFGYSNSHEEREHGVKSRAADSDPPILQAGGRGSSDCSSGPRHSSSHVDDGERNASQERSRDGGRDRDRDRSKEKEWGSDGHRVKEREDRDRERSDGGREGDRRKEKERHRRSDQERDSGGREGDRDRDRHRERRDKDGKRRERHHCRDGDDESRANEREGGRDGGSGR